MKITLNLKGNFKLVPEGERELTITKAECKPSGKPARMEVTLQDSEGGFINSRYNFDNDKSIFAMGKLLETVLGLEDGDEFDTTKHPKQLIGKKVLCEVIHTKGTKPNDDGELPTFANLVQRTMKLISEDGEVSDSPRNAIADDDEDDLD